MLNKSVLQQDYYAQGWRDLVVQSGSDNQSRAWLARTGFRSPISSVLRTPGDSGVTAGPAAGLAGHGFIELFVFLSVWNHSKQAAGEGQSEERKYRWGDGGGEWRKAADSIHVPQQRRKG